MKSPLKEVYELNHFLFSLCPCVLIKLSSVLLVLLVIMYQLLCWKYYYKGKIKSPALGIFCFSNDLKFVPGKCRIKQELRF